MIKAPLKAKCSCGRWANRNWNVYGNTDAVMKDNIRHSEVLGVHPNQIPLARKIHPGAEFTEEGAMIIHNRQEKLKRMKERTAHLRRCGSKMNIVEFN